MKTSTSVCLLAVALGLQVLAQSATTLSCPNYCTATVTSTVFPPDYTGTHTNTPSWYTSLASIRPITISSNPTNTRPSNLALTNTPADSTNSLATSVIQSQSTYSVSISNTQRPTDLTSSPSPVVSLTGPGLSNTTPAVGSVSSSTQFTGIRTPGGLQDTQIPIEASSGVTSTTNFGPVAASSSSSLGSAISQSSLPTSHGPLTDSPVSSGIATSPTATGISNTIVPAASEISLALYTCPNDNDLNYVSPAGQTYQLQCGFGQSGTSISIESQPDLATCVDSCDDVDDCVAVSYAEDTKSCSYKADTVLLVASTTSDTAASADLSCPNADQTYFMDSTGSQYQILCDTTFPASTTFTILTGFADAIACAQECSDTPECVGIAFDDGICTLASSLGGTSEGTYTPGIDFILLVGRKSVARGPDGSTIASTSIPATLLPGSGPATDTAVDGDSWTVSGSGPVTSLPTTTPSNVPSENLGPTPSSGDTGAVAPTSSQATIAPPGSSSSAQSNALTLPSGAPTPPTSQNTASNAQSNPSTSKPGTPTQAGSSSAFASSTLASAPGAPTQPSSTSETLNVTPDAPDFSTANPGNDAPVLSTSVAGETPDAAQTSLPTSITSTATASPNQPDVVVSGGLTLTSAGVLQSSSFSLSPSPTPSQRAQCPEADGRTYVDPSGSEYTIQCNTTYEGVVGQALYEPDVESCIDTCTANELCQGIGYDADTGVCEEYYAYVPGSGTPDTMKQFALLTKRAVSVAPGVTSFSTISTSFVSATAASTADPDAFTTLISSSTLPIITNALSSAVEPTPSAVVYTCPANDGDTVVENGESWLLACASGTVGAAYAQAAASNSFNDCFLLCDALQTCTSFTFIGQTNGDGGGTCYFGGALLDDFQRAGPSYVAAIRAANYLPLVASIRPSLSVTTLLSIEPVISSLLPVISADITIPMGLITTPAPPPTCYNGGNILNGCVSAIVTPGAGVGIDPSVGVGVGDNTLADLDASLTVGFSVSVAASANVGISLDLFESSRLVPQLSIGLDASLSLGLGATAGAGVTGALPITSAVGPVVSDIVGGVATEIAAPVVTEIIAPIVTEVVGGVTEVVGGVAGGATQVVGGVVGGVAGGLGGILGGGGGNTAGGAPTPTTTTTIRSTTTITSCSTILGGAIICPVTSIFGTVTSTSAVTVVTPTITQSFGTVITTSHSSSSSRRPTTSSPPAPANTPCVGTINALGLCIL